MGGDMFVNKLKMLASTERKREDTPPRKMTLGGDEPLPPGRKMTLPGGEDLSDFASKPLERKMTLPGNDAPASPEPNFPHSSTTPDLASKLRQSSKDLVRPLKLPSSPSHEEPPQPAPSDPSNPSGSSADESGKTHDPNHHHPHHGHRHGIDDEPVSPRTPRGTSHRHRPSVPPLSLPANTVSTTPTANPPNSTSQGTLAVAPGAPTQSTTPRTPHLAEGVPSTLSKQRKIKPPLPQAPPPSARLLEALKVIMAVDQDAPLTVFSANPQSISLAPSAPAPSLFPVSATPASSPVPLNSVSPTISPTPATQLSVGPQKKSLFPPGFSLKSSTTLSSDSHNTESPGTPRSSTSTTPRPGLSSVDTSHSLHVEDEESLVISAPLSPCEAYGDILSELAGTEERYVGDLQLLVNLFIKPIREKHLLSDRNIYAIFSCAETIYKMNSDLLLTFKSATFKTIGQSWAKMPEILKYYTEFCGHQDSSSAVLQKKMKKANFRSFINETYKNPQLRKLQLRDLLIKPFQRLCRYTLLIREIQKNIDSEETTQLLKKTGDKIQEVIERLNDTKKNDENNTKILEIQNLIENSTGPLKLISPTRRFIKEGFFKEWSSPPKSGMTDMRYFLFTDLIIRAKPSILCSRLQLKSQISLDMVSISSLTVEAKKNAGMNPSHLAFELNHVGTAKYITVVNTAEELEFWVSQIDGIIKKLDSGLKKASVASGVDPSLVEDMLSAPSDCTQPKRRSYTLGLGKIAKHLRHPSRGEMPPASTPTPTCTPPVSTPPINDPLRDSTTVRPGASGTGINSNLSSASGASASASAGASASACASASATASLDNASSDTDSDIGVTPGGLGSMGVSGVASSSSDGTSYALSATGSCSSIAMLANPKKGKNLPDVTALGQQKRTRFCCTFEANTRWVEVPQSVSVEDLFSAVSSKFGFTTPPKALLFTKQTPNNQPVSPPQTISTPGDVQDCLACGARLTIVS
ncbi:calmodulin-binding protein [Pelomyxa schiedti]|nr:calmodulin-binding protein [Pelomyxa schiedti]